MARQTESSIAGWLWAIIEGSLEQTYSELDTPKCLRWSVADSSGSALLLEIMTQNWSARSQVFRITIEEVVRERP
jgi:hypothetical protein